MPINGARRYRECVTETPEPTLADVLAAVNAQSRAIANLAASVSFVEANQNALRDSLAETRGQIRTSFETVARDMTRTVEAIGHVREDIAGVKADTAFVERWNQDMHEALVRHIADPNAHRNAA